MGPPEPAIARALGGRVWSWTVASAAALGGTALFAALVDAQWTLAQAGLGAIIGAALLVLGGILVRHRRDHRQGTP